MDITQAYNLVNANINENVLAVDNPFISQLAYLATEQAKQLKLTSFILRNGANNRGEIAQANLHSKDKSVLDITKLTPLVNTESFSTLQEEIAFTRNWQLQFHDTKDHPTWWKDNQEMLMVDYLLASSLCLVEIFDKGVGVEKYFATRNRFLAGALGGMTPQETMKYGTALQSFSANYETKQLKALKVGVTKGKFKVTQPRNFIDFNRPIKITPVFLMTSFLDGIGQYLNMSDKVVKFKYLKDNLTEREFITTTNPALLLGVYGTDMAQKMIASIDSKINRGYVRLPEFGISKHDYTGVRALNISRITEIELLDPNDVDLSFVEVDFDRIVPSLIEGVRRIQNLQYVTMVYEELSGKPVPQEIATNMYAIQDELIGFIETQYAIGTTTAQRHMHRYMVARSQLFPQYNGGKPIQYGSQQQGNENSGSTGVNPLHSFGEPTQTGNPLESFGGGVQKGAIESLPSLPSAEEPKRDSFFGVAFNLGSAD